MKTIRKIHRMTAAGLGALLLLAACDHKELCYQHPHTSSLHVVFDWREAPDADPESMYVWFFPEEGGEPVQYHLAGKAGGAVSLAEGRYDVLALNGDTEKIRFADTKRLDRFTVGATSGSLLASMGRGGDNVPRAEGTEDTVLFESTRRDGMMFGFTGSYRRVKVPYDRSKVNAVCRVKLGAMDETHDLLGEILD